MTPWRKLLGSRRRAPLSALGRLSAGALLAAVTGGCALHEARPVDPQRPAIVGEGSAVPGGGYTSWVRHHAGDIGDDRYAVPLPDDGGVVFAANRHGPRYKLYRTGPVGRALERLTAGKGDDAFPAISPDGRQLTFASTRNGHWQLFLMSDLEDREPRLVGEASATAIHPCWSPDGRRLAYNRRSPVTGRWEIWLHDLATHHETVVTEGLFPAFSPDGTLLAFQRHRQRGLGWYSIWTVRTDGTREREIVAGREWGAVNPTWSPSGRWIAFNSVSRTGLPATDAAESASPPSRGEDLYCVAADGSGLRQLTFEPGAEWNPQWGADGRIYFNATVAGSTGIWSISVPELP